MTVTIFPLTHEEFRDTTQVYGDLTAGEVEAIANGNLDAVEQDDPLLPVLELTARPGMVGQDEQMIRAYRTGACLGATIVRRSLRAKGIALPSLDPSDQPVFEELPEHTTRNDAPMQLLTPEGWARSEDRNGIGRFVVDESALVSLGILKTTWTQRAANTPLGLGDRVRLHDRVSIGLHDALFNYAYAAGETIGEIPKIHDYDPTLHFLKGEPVVASGVEDKNYYNDPKDRGSVLLDMGADIIRDTGWSTRVNEGTKIAGLKTFKSALVQKDGEIVEAGIASTVQELTLEDEDMVYAVDHGGDKTDADGTFSIYQKPFNILLNSDTFSFDFDKKRFTDIYAVKRGGRMYLLKDMGDMSPSQILTLSSGVPEFGDYSWSRMLGGESE